MDKRLGNIKIDIEYKNLNKSNVVKIDELLRPHLQLEEEQLAHLKYRIPEAELRNVMKMVYFEVKNTFFVYDCIWDDGDDP